jgi:hypothetical protein
MKIKRNARTILVIMLVLIFFSSVVIWHDKPPERLDRKGRLELINRLSLNNENLVMFISQQSEGASFYSIGMKGKPWPIDLARACYPDPIAARWQFSEVRDAYLKPIQVYRYRSLLDFLDLLYMAEQETPGTMESLDFKAHILREENVLGLSLRSVTAMILAIIGLMLVSTVKPKS